MSYSVVWFKRDLRLYDHAALNAALKNGPVLCLYLIEPALWATPDAAAQHYEFILESLRALYVEIKRRGAILHVVTGQATEVLQRLHAQQAFHALYSHEETGNGLSYQRDLDVARWCKSSHVKWHEFAQFGVVRGLKDRNLWKNHWDAHVSMPLIDAPSHIQGVALPWQALRPLTPIELGLDPYDPPSRQRGGRTNALAVLDSFLSERSNQYRGGISSPLSAPTACSRISAYLAYGCLSLREVVQGTAAQLACLHPGDTHRSKGLNAFVSRLYWHCHFIQKLESEPALEHQNLHRGYNGLRENDWNAAHFEALVAGRTGWPLVDACVAMLKETGWLNFRMRAMLVSTAGYPLWLHWKPVGNWLARQFLDYEPGIHWSQIQMQSGTTGINIPRIYNPIKQARDHDPQGVFVRRWIPALKKVPDTWIFEPWRMPDSLQIQHGLHATQDIAQPLVNLEEATREAKKRLFALRAQADVKAGKAAIVEKHASRKRTIARASPAKNTAADSTKQVTSRQGQSGLKRATVTRTSPQQSFDF